MTVVGFFFRLVFEGFFFNVGAIFVIFEGPDGLKNRFLTCAFSMFFLHTVFMSIFDGFWEAPDL